MADIQSIYSLQIRTLDDVKSLLIESKDRIIELKEQIEGEVIGDPALSDLNSTSKVAIWRLWIFITAVSMWLHEFLWVKYRVVLEEAARFVQSHTAAWYQQKVMEFQNGDTVQVVNGAVVYDPIIEANRIVKAAAVVESFGASGSLLTVKAAKEVSGSLTALSSGELTNLDNYVNAFKDAGVQTNVVSLNPDVLKVQAEIFYNPTQDLATFQTAIESAFNAYLKNLPFDGVLRRISIIDALQTVTGFVDVDIAILQASVAYTSTPSFQTINLSYETVAGYIVIDPNFPLSSQLTYTPI